MYMYMHMYMCMYVLLACFVHVHAEILLNTVCVSPSVRACWVVSYLGSGLVVCLVAHVVRSCFSDV